MTGIDGEEFYSLLSANEDGTQRLDGADVVSSSKGHFATGKQIGRP